MLVAVSVCADGIMHLTKRGQLGGMPGSGHAKAMRRVGGVPYLAAAATDKSADAFAMGEWLSRVVSYACVTRLCREFVVPAWHSSGVPLNMRWDICSVGRGRLCEVQLQYWMPVMWPRAYEASAG